MRPIVHPSYLVTYLEKELSEAMTALEHAWNEIDDLRAALKDAENEKLKALVLSEHLAANNQDPDEVLAPWV